MNKLIELVDEVSHASFFNGRSDQIKDQDECRKQIDRENKAIAKIQAIADSIEKTEQQRDKLLDALKTIKRELQVGYTIRQVDKLIAECEDKNV